MMNEISILKLLLVYYDQVNLIPYRSNFYAKQISGSECLP